MDGLGKGGVQAGEWQLSRSHGVSGEWWRQERERGRAPRSRPAGVGRQSWAVWFRILCSHFLLIQRTSRGSKSLVCNLSVLAFDTVLQSDFNTRAHVLSYPAMRGVQETKVRPRG